MSRLAEDAPAEAWSRARKDIPLAILQHGHQCLITDGYDNREGISEVLDGFATVLALHLKHRIPLNLHLSGTLIESIAWHSPDFFDWVKALRHSGLLEMVGSSYAQNIMTLFSYEHNLRQLNETLDLYRRHLDVEPREIKAFWVPERVWDTGKLAPVLRSRRLLNGGYDYVLFDDRLTYSLDSDYESSERHSFDMNTAPALWPSGQAPRCDMMCGFGDGQHLRPFWIEGGEGLAALPISAELRYCIPPRHEGHWSILQRTLHLTAAAGPGAIALYGDDMEKTATLGPWTSGRWRRENVTTYEQFLAWASEEPDVEPVLLSSWLASHPPQSGRSVAPGTFYELARSWRAGEDYTKWWQGHEWEPYQRLLADAEALLQKAAAEPQAGLWDLAWKQLMACSYETAWHGVQKDGACRPSPWAKAAASHVRSVFVIADAAQWLRERDGRAHIQRLDIDGDGGEEVVLKNDHLVAVLAPDYGGRLVYLFDLTQKGGRLVVGNPADDWNWQEEQNRFMEVPRNHPGALADVGHENDRYEVQAMRSDESGAEVSLVNREEGSPLAGTVKTFRVAARAPYLEVLYRLPEEPERFGVEFCLSPDYLGLLRKGRQAVRLFSGRWERGYRSGATWVWVRVPPGEPVIWDAPVQAECGHGAILRLAAYRREFRLQIGVGAPAPSGGEPGDGQKASSAMPAGVRAEKVGVR